jgi:HEAT repeat protein
MDSRHVAQAVQAALDDRDIENIVGDLARGGESARVVVRQLALHEDPAVRAFAGSVAKELYGNDAVDLLRQLVMDRDPDVSDTALQDLLDLSPGAAAPLLPRIRARARAGQLFERIFAIWTLAHMRDAEALPMLRAIAAGESQRELADVATVAALVIEGRADEVLARLLQHEHHSTKALAAGAFFVNTQTSLDALHRAAAELPDEQCRAWCNWYVDRATVRDRRVRKADP